MGSALMQQQQIGNYQIDAENAWTKAIRVTTMGMHFDSKSMWRLVICFCTGVSA